MRLFEFAEEGTADDNSLEVEITAIVSQMLSRMKDTGTDHPISLKALLSKLSDADINISEEQFREMINAEPLSNLVANVQNGNVIFKGEPETSTDAFEPEQSTKTLKSMAKRAQKNRD